MSGTWLAFFRNAPAVVGTVLLLCVIVMAAAADLVYPGDPLALAGRPLQWPLIVSQFPLGTDASGRDIAAQIFHGARVSLLIGVIATTISVVLGIGIGATAGFFGGWTDELLMRVTEAFQTLPNFLLLLLLVAVFGSTLPMITIAIGVVGLACTGPPCARRVFVAAQPRIRASLSRAWHGADQSHDARDTAQRAAASDRLYERDPRGLHPA